MIFFPKPIRKKKSAKPLKRSRRLIASKSVFKAHGDNVFKTYRRRFTDYQVTSHANVCRQERLRNRTAAEMAFCAILDDLGVLYESEAIILNGDRFVLIDMLVRSQKLAFEVDGSSHDNQKGYDAGRDTWLLRVHGIRTIRISNAIVFKTSKAREIILASLA